MWSMPNHLRGFTTKSTLLYFLDGALVPYKLLTLVVMDEKLVHHAEDKLRNQGSTTASICMVIPTIYKVA